MAQQQHEWVVVAWDRGDEGSACQVTLPASRRETWAEMSARRVRDRGLCYRVLTVRECEYLGIE
jgi:hypothetical protein